MKALILAAGRGKRLDEVSLGINKCMLKVQGKYIIAHSLDCVATLPEIEQVIIVVGYHAQDIMREFGSLYRGKNISYVRQQEQQGLVDAIECARVEVGASDFMLMLGDELMLNPHHPEFIKEFLGTGVFALCGTVKVSDTNLIKKTYAVIQNEDRRIFRLIEKPNYFFNNLMGTGNCLFKNKIFDYIAKTPINQKRHEKELPDLIQCAIDEGEIVRTFSICEEYINVNSEEELRKANSYFAHL
ncbi:MAG: sugar phosphate nucleotidyltransferase [Candidatus Omnitrophota bacterium]